MKILVFAPYYPPHIGGVESYASELDVRLTESGHVLTVFAPHLPASTPKEESRDGVRIIRYPAFEPIPNYPMPRFWKRDFFVSLKKLKRERFDITISHTRFFFSSFLALRFATSKNTPLVHIEHGSSFVRSNNPIVSTIAYLYDQLIGKDILKKATHIIAISDSVRIFVEKLTRGKVQPIVIYRGFDWQSYETIETDDSKWLIRDETTTRIIYIGRLISGKGVADLISALGYLEDSPWQCLIIGDGPERKQLETLAKNTGVSKNICFLGTLPHTQTLAILKSADIFVNPSHTEGLPTTVAEAALLGKTIIATDVGGTPEIITDHESGILLSPHDAHGISQALRSLASNNERRTLLGNAARKQTTGKFGWDVCIQSFETLFDAKQ